ncbi:MAG: serine hydroxymethyltransferase [Chloroflexi bacterium]|nr:serine hydroxymethyltransferase [Chloroflexota bacterium]MQC18923.1 serine hydroxymethyltransferase [Chloroflexota bacterium]
MGALDQVDPEVAAAIRHEEDRQSRVLEMIPSENYASAAVIEAVGSVLTNKYAEGYPGARYYHGNEFVDDVEDLARDRAKALFGVDHANVQPHSGTQANMAVYLGLIKPGDTVMGLKLDAGGHLTHGSPVSASGMLYNFVSYGVDRESHLVDYEEMHALAKEHRPKILVVGATAYPRLWDFKRAREIADEVGAILMADMAHIAGLVAGGAHPSPAGLAQVMTTSTHKTLRGPRGGMVLCDRDLRRQIDRGVFPGSQGGPMMHVIAGKAVMLKEAATPEFAQHSQQVVANAKALAASLMDTGMTLISGGTDNHLVLVDVRPMGLNGVQAADALEAAGIVVNSNPIPFDTLPPREGGGIRFGTPAITSRGLVEADMTLIGQAMARVLAAPTDQAVLASVKREVEELCAKHPAPGIPAR